MPTEGVEIPIKLKDIDKAQKEVDGLRASVKNFFEDMKKSDEQAGRAISASAGTALGALSGVTNGLGTAMGQGGFQQMQVQLGRNVANAGGGIGSGIGGAIGGVFGGPIGSTIGSKVGGFFGEWAGGELNREIDLSEIPRQAAKERVAAAAGNAGRFGITFSDLALQKAIRFTEGFEKRGYAQQRRVLDMQVWR